MQRLVFRYCNINLFLCGHLYVCVCVCRSAPKAIIDWWRDVAWYGLHVIG